MESNKSKFHAEYTPLEYAIACRAFTAFDREEYADEAIAGYMTPDVTEKIFG